jgi:hypothetical protein
MGYPEIYTSVVAVQAMSLAYASPILLNQHHLHLL